MKNFNDLKTDTTSKIINAQRQLDQAIEIIWDFRKQGRENAILADKLLNIFDNCPDDILRGLQHIIIEIEKVKNI